MLHLKALRGFAFVPVFILNIFIPAINYLVYRRYGISDRLYTNILELSQCLMPLASVWCCLLVLRDYLEGSGNELLYVNNHSNKFADVFTLFFLFVLNITVIFAVYWALISQMSYEYLRILTVCIFYFGLTYSLGFFTKSTTLTILAVVLYTLANLYFQNETESTWLLYFSTEKISKKFFLSHCLPLCLSGVLLTAAGVFFNTKKLAFAKTING